MRAVKLPIILSLLMLSACATRPDPAEVCTADWIDARAEKAIKRIEKRTDKAFDAIRSAGETWLSGNSPGPVQMYRLSRAFNAVETELKSGPGATDLRFLARTCNDPDFIQEKLMALLDRADVPERIVVLLDELGLLNRAIVLLERGDDAEAAS